jgi:type VI secretion system protein VasD
MSRLLSTLFEASVHRMRTLGRLIQLSLALGLLLSCAMQVQAQDAKEPTKLILTIEAASGVNPDTSLRPSPIKVRIYELKDPGAFSEADYFSLDTADKVTLAADMLAKDEFILRPGESRTIERKSKAQTTAIGVLAGYRDLPNSTWRVVHKLKEAPEASWMRALLPANRADLAIQLQPQGISLTEKP